MMRSPRAPRSLQTARRSAHLWRDMWFLLAVLLLGAATLLVFSTIGASLQQQSQRTAPALHMLQTTSTVTTTVNPSSVSVRAAQARLYPFPKANAGLMQPAVDEQGNIWVGEMFANRLARLDSRTGVVMDWEPPNGKNGLMSTAIDSKGDVWFVEQGANYVGRFDPLQQAFHTFPLASDHGRPIGPQDLQFDARVCSGLRQSSVDELAGLIRQAVRTRPGRYPRPAQAWHLPHLASR